MTITISSKNNEKQFSAKEIVNIGSNKDCDYTLSIGYDFVLTIQFDPKTGKAVLLNTFNNPNILFKGQQLPTKLEIEKMCKLMFNDSDEFITIKLAPEQNFEETEMEKAKAEIEKNRVSIIKQTGFIINDLKSKLSLNFKASLFVHIAMFLSSVVVAFGVSNYLTGLQIEETKNFIHLPTNIKILVVFAVVVYGLCLVLKQGVYLLFANKVKTSAQALMAQNFMLFSSSIFFIGIYIINLLYYINISPIFSILV